MKKKLLLFLCLQFFLEACFMNNSVPKITPSEIITTDQVSETFTVPTLNETCLEFVNLIPRDVSLVGELITYKDGAFSIFDLTTNSFIRLYGEPSPDGKKIASYEFGKEIRVFDNQKNLLRVFLWDIKWIEASSEESLDSLLYGWWDNRTLVIPSLPIGSMFLLDIDTGEVKEIIFPYSDEVYGFGDTSDNRDYYVSFSPTLESIVYASTPSHLVLRRDGYGDKPWGTVVWAGVSSTYANPSWSPNGTSLALTLQDEVDIENLYIVYTDMGGRRALTDLGTLFNHPFRVWISQINWSPNGEKIAFIAHVIQREKDKMLSRLLILDMNDQTLEDFCNPNPDTPYTSNGFSYVWSPDGKYIATDTTIVGLNSRVVYRIPDVYIADWVGEGKTQ